ncbi:MAG: hypothetical protein E7623_01780 [Ruminococcaceae bacterium]|nr:hypothetical protein [Oscillospiraceae bacterium]
MTTQTLYSDKKNMSFKYFFGELKRSWPKMVLYFVIFLLAMVLPLLMTNMGKLPYNLDMTEEENLLRNSNRLLSMMREFSQIWAPVSMFVAIFAGCYVTKILNNKISADFYHSTPMRRENIYFTRLGVSAITYLATFLINVIIVIILCETQTLAEGFGMLIFKQILKNVGLAFLGFLLIFSSTVFAGMLCGTTVMQLIMMLYVNLVALVYYLSAFATLEVFTENIYITYYTANVWGLVPFANLMSLDLIDALSVFDIICYVICSLLILSLSLVLYKARKIEKAGTPIVFDGFATFFRYSVLIPSTLLGGLFFKLLVGNFLWYVVGLVVGAVLCFMLVNTIISKNARKMFVGMKGFGIYAAIMLVLFFFLGFDVFGIDEYVPSPNSIESVQVTVSNEIINIEFKNKDVIKSALNIDRNRNNYKNETGYATYELDIKYYTETIEVDVKTEGNEEFAPYKDNTYHCELIYKTKSGIPIARRVWVKEGTPEMREFVRAVANSDEFEAYWIEGLSERDYRDYYVGYDVITEDNNDEENYPQKESDPFGEVSVAAQYLKDNFSEIDYDYFQRQQIGDIDFYGGYWNNGFIFNVPVHLGDGYDSVFMLNMSEENYYHYLAEKIDFIVISKGSSKYFSEEDDNVIVIRDKKKIEEVLTGTASLTRNNNIFLETEPLYNIGIAYTCKSYGGNDVSYTFTTAFLPGQVPSFVSDSFK